MKRVFLVLAFVGSACLSGPQAGATDLCVQTTLVTPVGTRSPGACVPTPLPEQATVTDCGGVPPVGVSVCVTLKIPRG